MSETQVEDFLAHFGVKGMKWGVRNGSIGSPPRAAKKSAPRVESTNMAALKVAGKEAAKAAVKYGLPAAAVAVGAGIPLAATLGVSVKVLDDPAVRQAIAPAGKALKAMVDQVGDIPMPQIPKVSSPFGVKTTRTKPDFNANYINGEWPMHTNKFGNLVPNPDYVGLKE